MERSRFVKICTIYRSHTIYSNTRLVPFNQGCAFVTFYYTADAIAALASEIRISGGRFLTVSIPRVNHKTPQTEVVHKVEKKKRQEFARPAVKPRNVPLRELLPKVILFLDIYIHKCMYYHVSLMYGSLVLHVSFVG